MVDAKFLDVPLPKVMTVSIAGFSGVFAWVFTHPFEMWKNTVMMAPRGTSHMDCLRSVRERGFFKGLSSGLIRQAVYSPTRLGCYPMIRDVLQVLKGKDSAPGVADRAVAGALSGAFASCLSSPVEVCLVLQTTSTTRLSAAAAARQIYEANGIAGFWRGIGALATRAALVGVCQVAVHDQVLTSLREKNNARAQRTGVAPYRDNIVVNVASGITALFYAFATMPVEMARVRMSSEASKGAATGGAKYTNVVQAICRIAREEGVLAIYDSFFPYFCRCATHTIACFFCIEYLSRTAKSLRSVPHLEEPMK